MKNFQDLTVHDYLRILRRRIWYLAIPAIVVSIAAATYVWRMPSIYKSETTILVSDRLLPEDYIGSLVRQSISDRIEFAKQQLRSRTFVERIAQEFQLVSGGANSEAVLNTVINNTEITVLSPNVFKVGFYAADPNTSQAVTRRLAERVMQSNTALRQEKVTMQYTGHHFCGTVWFDGKFHCLIFTFGTPLQTVLADTLDSIMNYVSSQFGSE